MRNKTGKWRRCGVCAVLLGLLGLLAGCAGRGYYQERAVDRARRFLLDECPEMPFFDQEYVKFNRPVFLTAPISPRYATGISQICITWIVPDNPESYMVFGTSGANMIDWEPNRVIRKNFARSDKSYLNAAEAVRDMVLQRQYGLMGVSAVNHVRYTLPGVWKCTLPLDFNPDFELPPEELAAASRLPRYVAAWRLSGADGEYYVFGGGTAQDDSLKGFRCYFTGRLSAAEFQAALAEPKPLIAPFGGAPDAEPQDQ